MQSIKVEAFVLRKKALLQKDLHIVLFSKEHGKLSVLAKGVRSLNSKRISHLQTGNLIKAELSLRPSGTYLHSTSLISGFKDIKHEQQLDMLYKYIFILYKILPENQAELEAYILTKQFIITLSKKPKPSHELFSGYLSRLMIILGYLSHSLTYEKIILEIEKNIGEAIPKHVIL